MEAPEQNSSTWQSGSKTSLLTFLLLLVTIILIAVLVYFKSQNVNLQSISVKDIFKTVLLNSKQNNLCQKTAEIKYDPKEWLSLNTYKDFIIKCTKYNLTGLNKDGEEQWAIPVSISNPVIKTAGAYLLLADIGGKDIYVVEGKEIKWSKKLDGSIINADISESGHVSVIKETKGYKGAVTVFNLQGNEFFTKGMVDRYIVSAKVSPTGKQVMANTMDASGITLSSNLEFTDMFGKESANKVTRDNALFTSVWYLNEGYIAAVSDTGLVCLDKDGKEKWSKDYTNRRVYGSAVSSGRNVITVVSGNDKSGIFNNNATDIFIYNLSGQQTASSMVDNTVSSIKVNSDIIAVNGERQVYFINTKGKRIGQYTPKSEIMQVYFLNKQEVVVATKNTIDLVKIY